MKALLVDDNVAPFSVEPSNGTTAIQCTPGAAPGGDGGLLAVRLFTNSGQVNFNSGDDADLFDVSPTCAGNALRITWNCSGSLLLNAGSIPGFNFTLVVDGVEVAELDANPGVGYSGGFAQMEFSMSRTFWVLGVVAGVHEVVLNAAFQGATAATGAIAANSSIVVEDWKLGGGTQSVGGGNAEFAQLDVPVPALAGNEFTNVNGLDVTGLFSSPLEPGDFIWVNALYISSPVVCFASAIECTAENTVAVGVVAYSFGSPDPGNLTVRIGRIAAP